MVFVSLFIALVLLVFFIRLTWRFWGRYDVDEEHFDRRNFLVWLGKGLALPILFWMFINAGLLARFPPLLSHIQAAKNGVDPWIPVWLKLLLPAAFVVGSYWAATTLLWLISNHALELEPNRGDLFSASILWGLLLLPLAAFVLYLGGLAAAGIAAIVLLIPVILDQLAFGPPKKRSPAYARALEKIKSGQFTAAEREVLRQLQRCDTDFDGWMMLAELYANHFNDLGEADRLIHELCRQTNITRDQMCQALHRLADWHLSRAADRAAAASVLAEICEAFPATHYGDVARKRMDSL